MDTKGYKVVCLQGRDPSPKLFASREEAKKKAKSMNYRYTKQNTVSFGVYALYAVVPATAEWGYDGRRSSHAWSWEPEEPEFPGGYPEITFVETW